MAAPPAYLDECVHHDLLEALRKRGFAVTAAFDEGTPALSDEAQLAYATTAGRRILTHNGKHFRRLHRTWQKRAQSHGGIVVLLESPPFERLEIRAALMLDWLATFPDYRSGLFTWGHLQDLLEQGYRLPGYSEADVQIALGRLRR